ncbi:hypothetical protein DERP_006869 [Dermatophagoides pteronyssinus]|uniref:Uncharacterized protein n=1 Tax=Dermatophagoides pteronyssinus TaxID=6956 RepID=A0ABQ8IS78_DERPT|nr:hypothetical protein DERP_006869 [Dermatophagoides pteronyssinus]
MYLVIINEQKKSENENFLDQNVKDVIGNEDKLIKLQNLLDKNDGFFLLALIADINTPTLDLDNMEHSLGT